MTLENTSVRYRESIAVATTTAHRATRSGTSGVFLTGKPRNQVLFSLFALVLGAARLPPARAQFIQQGPKLVGRNAVAAARQGSSVALSADGSTAIVGGTYDNGMVGAVWVYARSGDVWGQQGTKLVGIGAVGWASQGSSVALSADGNTAIVGGPDDNGGAGAVWVYVRSGGVWNQQGTKLVGIGAVGTAKQGFSVALSADGNTAIVGGPDDNGGAGAVWVYVRSGGVWSQQGDKLGGMGAVGRAEQGVSVALSADGNTAIVGGPSDNRGDGAAWVYTRSGSVWNQQGGKLVGMGAVGKANQGGSVALSGDGNTAIVGGPNKDEHKDGAVWVYTRTGGVWKQQGGKFVGRDNDGDGGGYSVALSGNGSTAIVGGPNDNRGDGAAWVYTRSGGAWNQQGSKLVGTGAVLAASQGQSVALSADGNTAIVGGLYDNNLAGAVWVYTRSGGVWKQQGGKLLGTGGAGSEAAQGSSVALSADGNTAVVGGPDDDGYRGAIWMYTRMGGVWSQQGDKLTGDTVRAGGLGCSVALSADGNTAIVGSYGAAWVYTRTDGVWIQHGDKLTGDAVGEGGLGCSVALSADGNTAIVGGPHDNGYAGAGWVYTRNGGAWKQQGSKLVGTGAVGKAVQGSSVALSADGNTAIVGGPSYNGMAGAVWVYTRTGGAWKQQGSKLVGTGVVGPAYYGKSVALSPDGNTAIVGGYHDNGYAGAVWVYTRTHGVWSQQGGKLVGTGGDERASQGGCVMLSADGNRAIVGGHYDSGMAGAVWVYTRTGGVWRQQGGKLVGAGAVGEAVQGSSVALSADGNTAIVGGRNDNRSAGAAWVFVISPAIASNAPHAPIMRADPILVASGGFALNPGVRPWMNLIQTSSP